MMNNGESSSESEGGDLTSADESSEDECKAPGGGGGATEDDVNNNDVSMKDISRDAGHEEVSSTTSSYAGKLMLKTRHTQQSLKHLLPAYNGMLELFFVDLERKLTDRKSNVCVELCWQTDDLEAYFEAHGDTGIGATSDRRLRMANMEPDELRDLLSQVTYAYQSEKQKLYASHRALFGKWYHMLRLVSAIQ